MSFPISKLLDWAADPAGPFAALMVVVGALLLWTRWRRAGRALVTAAALVVLFFGVLPTGTWLLAALENRFPQFPPPESVDGIVVLGGAVSPGIHAVSGQPALNDNAERMTAAAALARAYPQARLVFSGGSADPVRPTLKEAPVARLVFEQLGLDSGRTVFEDRSRNTWENATHTLELIRPVAGERWLLVTSAFHMPRAVGAFRRAGWDVMPYPVDYRIAAADWTPGLRLPGERARLAVHEWLGLAAYRLMGRSNEFFPGPR